MTKTRPAMEDDHSKLLEFIAALQEFERELGVDRKPGSDMAKDYLRYLKKEVKEKGGVILVAESGDDAVGFGAVWVEKDADEADTIMRGESAYAYIADVFVDESARQKGTGTKLLKALEREAKKRGVKEVRMHMLAHNVIMRLVTSKAGYQEEEIEAVKLLD